MSVRYQFLNDKQLLEFEANINTNKQGNDAQISSHFANSTDEEFREQLLEFIRKKKEDISYLCQKYSDTFGKSIEGARTLGTSSNDVKKKLSKIEVELSNVIASYKDHLEAAVRIRQDIQEGDEKIRANLEFQVLIQQLRNINAEIANQNLYIATVRTLEFANYDSPISQCTTISQLQEDVEPIIAHIEALADKKLSNWMIHFNNNCFAIGNAFLTDTLDQLPKVFYEESDLDKKNPFGMLDMSPIYEYYMVEKQLGKTDIFRQIYNDKREQQLQIMRNRKVDESIDRTDFVFNIVAGFFYTEYLMSADGFSFLEPVRAEKMWTDSINFIKTELTMKCRTDDVDGWINLSKRISNFEEHMSQCSMNSNVLQALLKERGKQIMSTLSRSNGIQISNILKDFMTLKLSSKDEYDPAVFEPFYHYMILEPLDLNTLTFPYDSYVFNKLPSICAVIEETLKKWIDFSRLNQDKMLVELYENLVNGFCNAMKKVINESSQIPNCGCYIASLLAFEGPLNYFEQFIQKEIASNIKQDKEKLKRLLWKTAEDSTTKLTELFVKFANEMFDSTYLEELIEEEPPHPKSMQLVLTYEAVSIVLQEAIPPKLFQITVERVAKHISNLFIKLINNANSPDFKWTPKSISHLGQNVNHICNWSTLISMPSAKANLNGLVKMLSLLTSNQLATYSSEAGFIKKNADIPYRAMLNILRNYKPVQFQNLSVIQQNLREELVRKINASLQAAKK